MTKYQFLRRKDSGRVKEIGRRAAPLGVPLADLVGATCEAIEGYAERAGLELMRRVMGEERAAEDVPGQAMARRGSGAALGRGGVAAR